MKTMCRLIPLYLLIFTLFVNPFGWSRVSALQTPTTSTQKSGQSFDVTVPSGPAKPLYEGQPGKQWSEIEFTPASRIVTMKLIVDDPNGYFRPNIRPENFAVYEDGVRQKNVTVEVDHSPVSVALLMEFGGRYHELTKILGKDVATVGRQLLDVVGRDDKIAIFKYDANVETLVNFNQSHDVLDSVFNRLTAPGFSEANFYDALLGTLDQMKNVPGRKAIIVISSGIDTFSKTTYQEVLRAAQVSSTPIYSIGLGRMMQQEAYIYGDNAPFARVDWNGAERQLEELAKVSGGRAYILDSNLDSPAIYDDIMENLRVRYVISYVSSNPAASGPPRKIRVELIDSKTAKPLTVLDSNGRSIPASVFLQESYSPAPASGG
jgi:Ca-activated chloride channel homolog